MSIINSCDIKNYFELYCKLWLQSKYDCLSALLETINYSREIWIPNKCLGRIIGGFNPLFSGTSEEERYKELLSDSRNSDARETYKFLVQLVSHRGVFSSMYDALKQPNPSRGTGITHAKFLCLLSALRNESVSDKQIQTIKSIQNSKRYIL